MSTNYTPQTWADGDATKPLSAARMTHLEDGIAAVDTAAIAAAAAAQATAIAASQPVDSDLTAIAALTTTAYGRSLLTQANAAAAQSILGLGSAATQATSAFDAAGAAAAAQSAAISAAATDATTKANAAAAASQPLDSDLTAIAALATTAFGRSFLALADALAARTLLGLGDIATHAASEFVTTANAAPLAQAGQTPSQAPVAPGATAAVGSLSATARADHIHPSAGAYFMYGPGFDGDITFDGTTTVTYLDGTGASNNLVPSSGVYTLTTSLACRNLTVNAGVTLVTNQHLLWASGTLSGSGLIINDGAAGLANGTAPAAFSNVELVGGGVGGAGNTGAGSSGQSANNSDQWAASTGGTGGTGASGAAGGSSGNRLPAKSGGALIRRDPDFLRRGRFTDPSISANNYFGIIGVGRGGGGGGGDGTNKGGSGGSGGGAIIINARILTGSLTIRAAGGAGGTPTAGNCGGGGGGGGGWALVNTADASGFTGTVTAPGGAAGAGVGTGTAGGAGVAGVAVLTVWP